MDEPEPSDLADCGYGPPRRKIIADPIHTHVDLGPLCVALMDSVPFQRLRDLKQLGLTEWVYPGALHNRFVHSLGVAHMAGKWTDYLLLEHARDSGAAYEFDSRDMVLAAAAGACHDLGHGPFSHVFEHALLPAIRPAAAETKWCHEAMSARILEHIIDERHIDLADYGLCPQQDLRTMQSLMTGDRPSSGYTCSAWLYDVVANKRNGVDVDKMDYLKRDSYYCGQQLRGKIDRICQLAKVVDDEICYHYKAFDQLHDLFMDRAMMHRNVYTHPKVKAIEYMLCDALKEAECVLQIAGKVDEIVSFITLTDDALTGPLKHLDPDSTEHPVRMRKAQALWRRVQQRELYCFCEEVLVPFSGWPLLDKRPEELAADIASYQSADGQLDLRGEDIIVASTSIDFSLKDQDPRSRLRFYQTSSSNSRGIGRQRPIGAISSQSLLGSSQSLLGGSQEDGDGAGAGASTGGGDGGLETFRMRVETVSPLLNEQYQERKLRVYTRLRDRRAVQATREAFRRWGQSNLPSTKHGCSPFSTPHKARQPSQHQPSHMAPISEAGELALGLGAAGATAQRELRPGVRHPLFQAIGTKRDRDG